MIRIRWPFIHNYRRYPVVLVGSIVCLLFILTATTTIPVQQSLANLKLIAILGLPEETGAAALLAPCDEAVIDARVIDYLRRHASNYAIAAALRLDCAAVDIDFLTPARPIDIFWNGVLLYRHNQAEAAVDIWRQSNIAAYFMSAALADRKVYSLQERWVDMALKIEPENWKFHYMHGILLLSHDVQLAENPFLHSIELNPDQIEAPLELGLLKYRSQEYAEAIRWCKQVTIADETNIHAWNCLAYAAFFNHNWEVAEPALRISIKLQSDLTHNYVMLGQILRSWGRSAEAEPLLQIATTIAQPREWSQEAQAWFELGMIYADTDRVDAAIEALNRSLELDPNSKYAAEARTSLFALQNP